MQLLKGVFYPLFFRFIRFFNIEEAREKDFFVWAEIFCFQRVLRVFLFAFEVRFLGTAIRFIVIN